MYKLPVIDAHVHLWDTSRIKFNWIESGGLSGVCLPEQYTTDCGGLNVKKLVFIQCECVPEQAMNEARFITELADSDKRIAAIIPHAPLENGAAVRNVLEELAQNSLVKGIRRMIEFESDFDFCVRPDFVKGEQMLAEFNYSFDINIDHSQMKNAIKLVKQCPDTAFILDHAGKPDIMNDVFSSWSCDLKELASYPNVCCKISHFVNKAGREKCTVESMKPYITHVLDCFGFERIAFASDWPICTSVADIPAWAEIFDEALGNITEEQREKIYYKNAERFYKLG